MPARRAPLDERAHDVVGIVRVADGVARPQQHLEQDVRDALRAARSSRSHGIFLQEAHRRVERRAAPHLEAEEIRRQPRDRVGDREHVVGAHARGQQRLMRIAHRRVGDEQPLLAADPLGELLRARAPAAVCRVPRRRRVAASAPAGRPARGSFRCGSYAPFTSGRPLTMTSPRYDRILVARSRGARKRNSSGVSSMNVVVASPDVNVGWPIRLQQERDVRLDAADAELAQRAVGALHRLPRACRPRW